MTIATKAEKMGLNPKKDFDLKVGIVGAEMLPDSLRKELEERFGMVVRQQYGAADVSPLGYECKEFTGMHIPEETIVEIVDPASGKRLPPGEVGDM